MIDLKQRNIVLKSVSVSASFILQYEPVGSSYAD